MSNIVSINKHNKGHKGSFLGTYIEAQNNQRIPEEVFFVAGVILTVGLPEFFLSVYGGLIPFIVFASSLLIGAALGMATDHYKPPYQTISLSKGTRSQVPTRRDDTTKKAA